MKIRHMSASLIGGKSQVQVGRSDPQAVNLCQVEEEERWPFHPSSLMETGWPLFLTIQPSFLLQSVRVGREQKRTQKIIDHILI